MNNHELFQKWQSLVQEGRDQEALAILMEYIRRNPLLPQGWVTLGKTYIRQGRRNSAALALHRGWLLDPEALWGPKLLMDARKLEQDDLIEAELANLLKVKRVSVSAVVVVLGAHEYKQVVRCLESLQDAVDQIVVMEAGHSGRLEKLAAAFPQIKIVQTDWQDSIAALRNEALQHVSSEWVLQVDAGEWLDPQDRQNVRIAAGLFHEQSPVLLDIWLRDHNGDEVRNDFTPSRMFAAGSGLKYWGRIDGQIGGEKELHPAPPLEHKRVRIRLHREASETGQLEERLLKLSVAEEPEQPVWTMKLGSLMLQQGRYGEARAELERALQLAEQAPGFTQTLEVRILLVKVSAAEQRWNDCRSLCEAILEQHPTNPDAHYYLAHTMTIQAGQLFAEAEGHVDHALRGIETFRGDAIPELSLRDWQAPVMLADLAVHQGRLADARQLYRNYKKRSDANLEHILDQLRLIEQQKQRLSEALADE